MENIESKQGKIEADIESVFSFLSDLRNFDSFIPEDKIQNWISTENTCSFSITQVGDIQLKIAEKEPHKFIKIEPEGKVPMAFAFYIQLMSLEALDTRIKLTFRAEMNSMMKMMIKSPVQKGLDQIIDMVCGMPEKFNPQ